jgi:hypothetical protein
MANSTYVPPAPSERTAAQKPAPGSGRLQRQVNRLKAKGAIEKTITEVDSEARRADREIRFHCFLRDNRRCRAFGTPLKFDTDNLKKKSENHHVIPKSAGGSDDPWNRCTLSPLAHSMRHGGELEITGNADETLTFKQYEFKGGTRVFLREWESSI